MCCTPVHDCRLGWLGWPDSLPCVGIGLPVAGQRLPETYLEQGRPWRARLSCSKGPYPCSVCWRVWRQASDAIDMIHQEP